MAELFELNKNPKDPLEHILDMTNSVIDLRDQLLLARAGKEAVDELAAYELGQATLTDLGAQIDSIFREQDPDLEDVFLANAFEGLSLNMFGAYLSELSEEEQRRVKNSQAALEEHSRNLSGINGTVAAAKAKRTEIDAELNRAFNSDMVTGFTYDGSKQAKDRFVVSSSPLASILVGDKVVKRDLTVARRDDGTPTGETRSMLYDSDGSLYEMPPEHKEEWEKNTRLPLDPEEAQGLADCLQLVHDYLQDQLDPNTDTPPLKRENI